MVFSKMEYIVRLYPQKALYLLSITVPNIDFLLG